MTYQNKIAQSITAAILGDTLGVPVEDSTRSELALGSVKNMLGYGRYDQPEGTWSDDSSMILCTMESLISGYSIEKIADAFCRWLYEGHWTPEGYAFDAGITTVTALDQIKTHGISPKKSGGTTEDDNGNGSLMRILPVALYFAHLSTEEFLAKVHEIAAITHAHPRSKIGCGIYALLVRALLSSTDKKIAFSRAVSEATAYYTVDPTFSDELKHYSRIISKGITTLTESEIESSGYVVHTLEASIWTFLTYGSTKEIVLAAVNLGLDTDTTATVAGGLAGLFYGLDSIPTDWLEKIRSKQEIDRMTALFAQAVTPVADGCA